MADLTSAVHSLGPKHVSATPMGMGETELGPAKMPSVEMGTNGPIFNGTCVEFL